MLLMLFLRVHQLQKTQMVKQKLLLMRKEDTGLLVEVAVDQVDTSKYKFHLVHSQDNQVLHLLLVREVLEYHKVEHLVPVLQTEQR